MSAEHALACGAPQAAARYITNLMVTVTSCPERAGLGMLKPGSDKKVFKYSFVEEVVGVYTICAQLFCKVPKMLAKRVGLGFDSTVCIMQWH